MSSANINSEIVPSNVASNGTISFRDGNPVIQFIIGEQDRLLSGQSIRFQGKFRALLSSGSSSSSDVSNLAMSERLGVYSCIDTLTIKSQRTGQTIESIRHYNRFLASYLPVTTSKEDAMGHMYESALIMPNYACQQASVVNIPSSSSTQNHFCMTLPCGLFNGGEPIPLMPEAVGGLIIELHLAPDTQVFHTQGDTDSASYTDSFYEFTDVSLVAELMELDESSTRALKSRTSGTYEYNSISSYYQTINSGNAIINFQLGLSRVMGVFANIVPSAHINNTKFDGLATLFPTNSDGSPAELTELFFTRNGTKFPVDFNITPRQRDADNHTTVSPEVIEHYMNAIEKFNDIGRTQLNPQNVRYTLVTDTGTRFDKDIAFGGQAFGIGVAFDNISDQGVDVSKINFGISMSLEMTTDFPQSFFVFAHAKNTLVYGPQGIQVMS